MNISQTPDAEDFANLSAADPVSTIYRVVHWLQPRNIAADEHIRPADARKYLTDCDARDHNGGPLGTSTRTHLQ
jgi:hypothetical protein